jgi:hypothetical protein
MLVWKSFGALENLGAQATRALTLEVTAIHRLQQQYILFLPSFSVE